MNAASIPLADATATSAPSYGTDWRGNSASTLRRAFKAWPCLLAGIALLGPLGSASGQAVDPTLGRPSIVAPSNLATGLGLPVKIQWTSVPGAARYELEVYESEFADTPVVVDRFTPGTSFVFESAQPATRYLFRVKAHREPAGAADEITGRWSRSRFTTAPGEKGPRLLSPADRLFTEATSMTLRWERVPSASFYEVQYWNEATSPQIKKATPGSKTELTILTSPTRITHWQVRAVGNTGLRGPWSKERIFGWIPSKPKYLDLAHSLWRTSRPTLRWGPGTHATKRFELEVREGLDPSTEPLVDTPVISPNTTDWFSADYALPVPLKPLTTYSWRVRAMGPSRPLQHGDWASTTFDSGTFPPLLLSPSNWASFPRYAGPMTFLWESISNIKGTKLVIKQIGSTAGPWSTNVPGISPASVTIPELKVGSYQWHIEVLHTNGAVEPSEPRTLTVREYH